MTWKVPPKTPLGGASVNVIVWLALPTVKFVDVSVALVKLLSPAKEYVTVYGVDDAASACVSSDAANVPSG